MITSTESLEEIKIAIMAAEAMARRSNQPHAIMMDLSVQPMSNQATAPILEIVHPVRQKWK
jgi:hypothetical protein